MGLFSDIISAVGNGVSDLFGGGGGSNNNQKRKQNNPTPQPSNNFNVGKVNLPSILQAPSTPSVPKPVAPVFNMQPVDNSNLTGGDQSQPHIQQPNNNLNAAPQPQVHVQPQPQPHQSFLGSLLHDATHNPVTDVVGGVAKGFAHQVENSPVGEFVQGKPIILGNSNAKPLVTNNNGHLTFNRNAEKAVFQSTMGVGSPAAEAGGEGENLASGESNLANSENNVNSPQPESPKATVTEAGTKPIEEKPTNAPSGENIAPTTAPGAPESGVKPVTPPQPTITPPKITTTPVEQTPTTPVVAPVEAAPTPAPLQAAQDAAQQGVTKAEVAPPETAPAPTAAVPESPAQAASKAVAENPDEQAALGQAASENASGENKDKFGNPVGQLPDRVKLLANKVNVMRKTNTASGNELADRIEATDARTEGLRAGWMHQLQDVFGLSDKNFRDAWDRVEGNQSLRRASPAVQRAAEVLKTVMPQVKEAAEKAGVLEGDLGDSYMPHQYNNTFVSNPLKMPDSVKTTAKQYGNLEQKRLTDNPNYEKSKNVLANYLQNSAQRIAQAENLGAKNEIAQDLVSKVGYEGGDAKAVDKALRNYIHSSKTEGGLAKAASKARGLLGFAQLSKAAISHAGQTSNTAVDSGIANTIRSWGKYLSNNPDDKEFISKTGVTNPQVLHGYRDQYTGTKGLLSRGTAPGLNAMMKVNRSVTALAYRRYGNALAKAGNIEELRKLGVTGDIGSKLTDEQELQAARGGVNRTMFSSSRAKTPTLAETPGGKFIGQYRTAYAYKQTGFLVDRVLKEAANGNLKPLARFLAVSAPVAGGTIALKNQISGNKEGPGGVAMDAAGALGGIPGEVALEMGRYAKNNLPGAVAGEIAPAAGTAYNLLKNTQYAIKSSPKPLERQGLAMIPGVGSRISKAVVPLSPGTSKAQVVAGAKQATPGIYDVKDKSGKPVFATLEGKNLHQFDTLAQAQTAQAKNEAKYKELAATDQLAKDKADFLLSGKQIESKNGMVYQNEGNGKVSVMQQKDYDYKQASDGMATAKIGGDLRGYVKNAQALLGNIDWQLKHATLTTHQRNILKNKAQTVVNDVTKYESYGGFTKGTSGSRSASSAFHALGLPSSGNAVLMPKAATGLTAGTAKYSAPTLKSFKQAAGYAGNPFARKVTYTKGVK